MKRHDVKVDCGPPVVKHTIRGMRLADAPVSSIEVLMHRHVRLNEWKLRFAADPYWRLYWPTSRGGRLVFAGNEHPLEPGWLYLIAPHTAFDSDCSRPFSKWYVHFTVGGLHEHCRPGILRIRPAAKMRALLASVCPSRMQTRKGTTQPSAPLETLELVLLAVQQVIAQVRLPLDADGRLPRCVSFLRDRIAQRTTLRDVARFAGVGMRTLSHMFVSGVGLPPMRYLIELRLNHAMKLLRHTDQTIEDIAAECGFPNRYYFTRMLSKYRQTTPAAFRARGSLH